jgi:Na+-transporting methylmalonyl-CoA/oxaloacetate decarboxylase gamma subunit
MSLLLTIGVAVICIVLIVSALLIVLLGLLARTTSSPPSIQLRDTDDNHQHTETEALSNGR